MLGKNIKDFRQEKGLTQKQLAKEIGASQGAVYFWEKEINEPTAGYLIKMAKLFEISVDELLSYENVKVNENKKNVLMMSQFNRLKDEQKEIVMSLIKELSK